MGKERLGRKEAKAAPIPQKWDKETDVVAVGYGLAGAAAAMTAHDAGAKVFILEKMPKGKEGGNSLRVSRDAHKIRFLRSKCLFFDHPTVTSIEAHNVCARW